MKMTRCSVEQYYSPSSEQCEPCANLCATDSSSNECRAVCPDYVNSTSRQPAVTTTLIQTLSTDWISNPVLLGLFLTLIGLSVLLTIAVIIYVVRIRRLCRRSPVGKYATVRANPVEQESARPPSPPTRACEESTDAAAAAVAGSHQHRYTPNSRSQQPFKGFRQTQERNRPV